jgi:hypothetical protein
MPPIWFSILAGKLRAAVPSDDQKKTTDALSRRPIRFVAIQPLHFVGGNSSDLVQVRGHRSYAEIIPADGTTESSR